jgi:hypothetical protein
VLLQTLVTLLITTSVWGTTFSQVSMEDQIDEADGVIFGHYLKSETVKLENGSIATQRIFKLNKEWGMQSDLFGMDEVIVHYPGGTFEDQTVKIQGVPEFVMGEKVAIFTKSVGNRYWGLNMGLGTYKVINYGNETLLINSIFPNDSKISQIKLEEFEHQVRVLKGSSLKTVSAPAYFDDESVPRSPASLQEGKKRTVASIREAEDNKEEQSSFSVFWLVTLLALSGALARLFKQRDLR